jgi:hypothetical protein
LILVHVVIIFTSLLATTFAQPTYVDSLAARRSYMSSAVAENVAVFASGLSAQATTPVVDLYDTNTKSWTTSSLSYPRYGIGTASMGTKAYFGGGVFPI